MQLVREDFQKEVLAMEGLDDIFMITRQELVMALQLDNEKLKI